MDFIIALCNYGLHASITKDIIFTWKNIQRLPEDI